MNYETPDDGSICVYSSYFDQNYETVNSEISDYIYVGDGYSVNQRQSAVFSSDPNKVGTPLCPLWNNIPPRYIYQQFPDILFKIREVAQKICCEIVDHQLTEAIVNKYQKGDSISYHKDYHPGNIDTPVSVVCSFEKFPEKSHLLQFYRTVEDADNPRTTKKQRGPDSSEFEIPLDNFSVAVMV
ncbi:uncharacterized protein METZ01_LOCUS370680, partial [marine metagenome]